ncbi:MAG: carboxypeptidase-like regulatory domain-containing protein [Ferruginibacter sp.]
MKKCSLALVLLLPVLVYCQDTIIGKVINENQEPLPGASVFIPNTSKGVQTDKKGEFVLTKVPSGNTKIVISFIGYETNSKTIALADRQQTQVIKLKRRNYELEAVTIANYDKDGWKNYGDIFTAAFIGTSAYAAQCNIKNKTAINFIFTKGNNLLHVYAAEPLVIENAALGYNITVTLADFTFNVATKYVDYQVYSFFEEMQGTRKQMAQWKKNRSNAYSLSLMHLFRAIYADNLRNEHYEVRILEQKKNAEKQRIQELYKKQFITIKDSLNSIQSREIVNNKLIERSFNRDSLKYYKNILEQEDSIKKIYPRLLKFKDIASRSDSNTIVLHFEDYLHITYTKTREPEEYINFKTESGQSDVPVMNQDSRAVVPMANMYPISELTLQQGIPIEINENGYFNNIDLFINGFWGWWEKMATKLPYEYEP